MNDIDLEDYFAATALQGIIAGWLDGTKIAEVIIHANDIAKAAYKISDAMMNLRDELAAGGPETE